MHARLPPLNALRAFEAAARHLSFRKAAEELHVTPTEISHQIRTLEQALGLKLFRRLTRGLELTEAAEACVLRLREGFGALAEAADMLRARRPVRAISVGAAPAFAAKWLVPRLRRFAASCPEIDLRVVADRCFVDSRQSRPRAEHDGVDIEVRFGTGRYPGQRAEKLFALVAAPLCSPALMRGVHPLQRVEDLRHHTLLHDDTISAEDGGATWRTWLEAAGVDSSCGLRFDRAASGLDAAIDGKGVVLGYPALASADLAAGRLVAPFDLGVALDFACYVVCAEVRVTEDAIAAFRDWIIGEAGAVLTPAAARSRPRTCGAS